MNIKELIGMIVGERLTVYFSQNRENGRKESQQCEKFQKLLEEKAPDLSGEFEKYLDCVTELDMTDKEKIYLFGVHDGIRLMRDIISTS